ncbi:sulfurtransferase [Leptotrichia sp. OH3620_COT-345]|uniref:rhodanese-like domain-containing protein n=1 Tax=Leptotrichia sp. OH3620_COT-345 TaxID=2491048 RepID=UPI000F649E49|nr:rhodanese-like domain-containing protein [Leptotrichia sp. OH3620_COT-345]RRD39642.1 sulfurtransferase [Leptotrichia sp. OH3620_COT-345]
MKLRIFLLFSTLTVVLGIFTSCNNNSVKEIKTDELLKVLDNPAYVIIDTREDSLYNGFKDGKAERGGHIKNAIQFSCAWLNHIQNDKFEGFAAGKGITKDKTLVFYGTDLENLNCVSAEFASRGYKVRTYNDFINYTNTKENPMESFPNFQFSVSPKWVNALLQGEKPETYTNDKFMLFEVSWGPLEKSKGYVQHITGAYHFDTDWIENAPVWNLSDPETMKQNLLKNGITKDKTIVLYSAENQLAAYRVFWALKWAGVEDVRVLDGNLITWTDAGFPTETKVNTPKPETDFGTVIPANPHINISMPEQALDMQEKEGLKLISNRSWDEYIGKVSGYDYIPGKGEIKGAIWGFAGTDSSNVADYYDPDGTLRNPKEIFELWVKQGIKKDDKLAFYCGTGWRATVSWFMTQMAGWKNSYIYDGGWNAWQMDSKFPVQKGAPNNMQKPDAENDFGKVEGKVGGSCKA